MSGSDGIMVTVMKMALQGDTLKIIEASDAQLETIRSWNRMKWNRRAGMLTGTADMELLDRLSGIVRLPPAIEAWREALHRVQDAVDRERGDPDPKPVYDYPVRLPLYRHQVRAANMALLTFGMVEPKEAGEERGHGE